MGLRRVLSVLMPPETPDEQDEKQQQNPAVATPDNPGQPGAANPMVVASQKYFKTITSILDNLKPGPSLGEQASWLNRYSKRIDQMPMVGVDPELIAWGADVSSALRTCAVTLANGQGHIRAAVATVAAPTHYLDYSVDNPRTSTTPRSAPRPPSTSASAADLAGRQAAVDRRGVPTASGGLDSRPKMRQQLVERYGVEF
jgi:hypothetical protein